MKKIINIILILLGVICLPFIIFGFFVANTISNVKDSYGYSNEDIIEYVDKKYRIPVIVIQNEGRDSSRKGLVVEDAIVRTKDEDNIEFSIYINSFGKITGDSYEEVKKRFDLNHEYEHSKFFQDLRELGFSEITFGEHPDDPSLLLMLPRNKELVDMNTFELVFDAIPLLRQLKDEVEKQGYDIDVVSVDGAEFDIHEEFVSPKDLGNHLAARNVDRFTYSFLEKDMDKLRTVFPRLEQYGFHLRKNFNPLACEKMIVYAECAVYSFTLYTYEHSTFDRDFRYDRLEDRENILRAIKDLQMVDLPIEKVYVADIYTPDTIEDQYYSEEELEAQNKRVYFAKRKVSIVEIDQIETVDDIEFVY